LELNNRLIILKDAKQIDEDIYTKLLNIISIFKRKLDIELTEENGAMFITHLAVALQRIKKGQPVNTPEEDVFSEVRNSQYFSKASLMAENIEKTVGIYIPEGEKKFLIIHVCALMEKEGLN
jgi:transcriptional regulatory protein LevR